MKGPPPINYATHPKRSVLASGGTSTTSPTKVAQTASAPVPAIPSAPTPRSGTLSVISIDPEWLEYLLDSTPPSPDVLSLTQMETATSTTPDEQAQTVDSLADILDGLSTDDTAVNIPPPPPPFVPASPAHIDGRGFKGKYYSVTVGKCCGVFQRWSYVKALVDSVPGCTYTGFKTYEDAANDYAIAKAGGLVRVVRNPGDELNFGPLSAATM